eukprot:gene27485-3519_t
MRVRHICLVLAAHTAASDGAYWTSGVSEVGDCTMQGQGCVSSYNYPNNYGSNQVCTITAPLLSKIEVISFTTESGYDWLTVNGDKYEGTSGPTNVVLTSAQITWRSDGNTELSGWSICFSTATTTTITTTTATATLSRSASAKESYEFEYAGKLYGTLDKTPPTDRSAKCQGGYLPLPAGAILAPDTRAIRYDVIAKHAWGTHAVVVANGNGYTTTEYATAGNTFGSGSSWLLTRGNTYASLLKLWTSHMEPLNGASLKIGLY